MTFDALREYCLSLPGTAEKMPFGETTLVFTVADKLFCLTDLEMFESMNLKCDPETALLLRERYADVLPGYHMNKRHWNTVLLTGAVPDPLLRDWIEDSYRLVVAGLSKKQRETLL
ncbi:MAG: MmcQ/YjbR family DNA-binding protein [Sphingobacteriales bacterium]|nr:MAG: MmcQ/YjbR family DNA-binding protein [Sphingobacteriales bacterium]